MGAGADLRLRRTLRLALRAVWDFLGLVCAASFTVFAALTIPLYATLKAGTSSYPVLGITSAALAGAALILGPLYAGICLLAHRALTHDEPTYGLIWSGPARFYLRAATCGLIQLLIFAIMAANVLFYLRLGGFAWFILAALFTYLGIFWAMNCVYHMPLLVAGEEGVILREDGGKARQASVFRNAFLMASTSPAYTLGLLAFLLLISAVLTVSGVGAAMLGAGIAAFVTTQATRDQLLRFGVVHAPPDPDESVEDERWRMRG